MTQSTHETRNVVVTAAKIYTSAEASPVEAISIIKGRVVQTGRSDDLIKQLGSSGTVLNFDDKVIMPGLVDTHPHLLHFAVRSSGMVDLADAQDHDDIIERIRAKASLTPPGTWIVTTPVGEPHYFVRRSWRDLAERCLPDRHVLDRATISHPVFIQAYGPVVPNVCAFNSKGLQAVGITDTIPDRVCDVWIDKDDSRRVTGLLRGAVTSYYSYDPFWSQIKTRVQMPAPNVDGAIVEAMSRYNRLGVTTIYEAHNMAAAHIEAYRRLRNSDALTLRVMTAMEIEAYAFPPFQPKTMKEFEDSLELAKELNTHDDDEYFCVKGATLSEGGPCWSGHLRMHEPYRDPFGNLTKGTRFMSPEKLKRFISYCACEQLRGNFVVAGYADHDDVLNELEAAEPEHRVSDRSWLLQHAMLVTPKHASRMKALNLDVTTSMSFSWGKGDIYKERIGVEVWQDLIPLKRLLNAGLRVGCGSDWGPKNIFEHIALAQTHEFCGSGYRNNTADHVISRRESISCWTDAAADVIQWSGVGRLLPGCLADFIVLDDDPFECSLDSLVDIEVLRTYLGGCLVYNRDV
jgi:predicted amidohydrolase YtcJ